MSPIQPTTSVPSIREPQAEFRISEMMRQGGEGHFCEFVVLERLAISHRVGLSLEFDPFAECPNEH